MKRGCLLRHKVTHLHNGLLLSVRLPANQRPQDYKNSTPFPVGNGQVAWKVRATLFNGHSVISWDGK